MLATGCGGPVCPECDDGDPCTLGECIDDACVLTLRCDDSNPCTVDSCAADGTCSNEPLCDDGLTCTVDTCNPDGTCSFEPMDSICAIPRDCMTSTCLVPPTPGPGQRVVAGGISGCFDLLDDGFCTNNWDGCACNGAEVCVGSGGDVQSGCGSATTRDQWPCDANGGDGDGCTEETCCEPWNPAGCREHAAIAAATPPGETSQYEQFCTEIAGGGESNPVVTPLGTVACVTGDHQYGIRAVDPLVGDPLPVNKPNGYWCEDCNPCTAQVCTFPTGACPAPFVASGTSVPEPPPPWLPPFVNVPTIPSCTTPQFCDGETNFGCGYDACYTGTCLSGPNANNQGIAPGCNGFPVVEFDEDTLGAFPNAGPQTCYELECQNTGFNTAPNWTCVADPADALCDNDLFCDGPGTCSLDEFCTGCTAEQVGSILASVATSFEPAAPAPGNLIYGCVPGEETGACDDGIDCTVDLCSESSESCENVPDDRNCVVDMGAEWSPCDPATVCMAGDGCVMPDGDPPCGGTDQCPLDCSPLDNGRECAGDPTLCGEPVCHTETYRTVALDPINDLCPFHPDGQIPEGDREFDGNGPAVGVSVALEISADRHQLLANVHFEARETAADHSTIRWDSAPIPVFTTAGEILSVTSPTTGHAFGISADGGTVGIACGGCGIVDFTSYEGLIVHAEARGDTPNDDISHDNDCNTEDTLLQLLEFDEVEVLLREDCLI